MKPPRRHAWPCRSSRHTFKRLTVAVVCSLSLFGVGSAPWSRVAAQASSPQAATGTPTASASPAQFDRSVILMLVRSTLLALQHANETGNYTVLRDLGAPGFQTAYTAARLAEVFAGLRNGRVDMSAVAVLEPQITQGPHIEQGNLVRLTGFFATGGQQLNFELAFQPVDGRLKLFGVSANLAQPQAASGQGAGAATKQAERPNPGTGANPGSQPTQTTNPAPNPKP